jgi:hypothetical protein
MHHLAQGYLRDSGKKVGDWGDWGEHFPDWISAHLNELNLPYLADCARLDWLIHRADRSIDKQPDYASFEDIANYDDYNFSFEFATGAALIESTYPIVSIYDAHRGSSLNPDLQSASDKLAKGIGETALVWRRAWQPMVREVFNSELPWLALLNNPNKSVRDIFIEQDAPIMPIESWLSNALAEQLVIGLLPSSTD